MGTFFTNVVISNIMGQLIVSAEIEDTIAHPRNRQPLYIIVSVTSEDGKPVRGLIKKNFTISAQIMAPAGAGVRILRIHGPRSSGIYHIQVVPVGNTIWKYGRYIFAVIVRKDKDRGQTLTSVLLD